MNTVDTLLWRFFSSLCKICPHIIYTDGCEVENQKGYGLVKYQIGKAKVLRVPVNVFYRSILFSPFRHTIRMQSAIAEQGMLEQQAFPPPEVSLI